MKLEHYAAAIELHLDGESPQDISSELGISVATVYRILQIYRTTKAAEKVKQMEAAGPTTDFEEEELEEEDDDDDAPTSSIKNLRTMLNGPDAAPDRRETLRSFRGLLRKIKKGEENVDADSVDEVLDQMTDTLTMNGVADPEDSGAVQLLNSLKDEVEEGDNVEQKILAEKGLGITDLQDSDTFDADAYANEKLGRKLEILGDLLEEFDETELTEENAQRLIDQVVNVKNRIPETQEFDELDDLMNEQIEQLQSIKNHGRGFFGLGSLPPLQVDVELLDAIDSAREALGCVLEDVND